MQRICNGGITPKGSRSIQYDFMFRGARYRPCLRRASTEANLRRAREHLGVIKERIASGTFQFAEEFPAYRNIDEVWSAPGQRTCSHVFDAFLDHCVSLQQKGGMEAVTTASYEKTLNGVWRPAIGQRNFLHVTHSEPGFLNAGALTVLGTVLPIRADRAALTVARLLLRIGEVPEAVRARQTVDWRAFMSELLRMAHVTEIAFDIAKIRRDESALERIQTPANVLIGERAPDWAVRTEHAIREFARQEGGYLLPDNMLCQLSDAMKYIQLGHPELIQIIPDEWTELHQADVPKTGDAT